VDLLRDPCRHKNISAEKTPSEIKFVRPERVWWDNFNGGLNICEVVD
jgi:hypothetical protein